MRGLDKGEVSRNAFVAGCAGVLAPEVQIKPAFVFLFVAVMVLPGAKASSQPYLVSSGQVRNYVMLPAAVSAETATEHLSRGNNFAAAGDLESAITEYRAALLIKPDFFEAHANLANALKAKGDLDRAIAEYRAALRINPDFSEPHYSLGNA